MLPFLAAGAGACSDPAMMAIDAGDESDAGEPTGGAYLRFRTIPELNSELAISDATFAFRDIQIELSDLRLIGDAATGDERTRIEQVRLEWNGEVGPVSSASYPDAPPGLYSIVRGAFTAFAFSVDVERDGMEDFRLEVDYEQQPIAIDIALESQLEAGAPLEVDIAITLADVLASIDLDELVVEDGTAEIVDESPLLGAIADSLSNSFSERPGS